MSDLSQLKVGDKVLINFSGRDPVEVGTVAEITKSGKIRVGTSLYRSRDGHKVGESGSYYWTYITPYDEVVYNAWITKRNKIRLVRLFSETRFQDLSLEALQELLTVLQKHRKPVTSEQPIPSTPTA